MGTKMLIATLSIFVTFAHLTCTSVAVEANGCEISESAKEWNPHPQDVVIDVYWSSVNESNKCQNSQGCNDSLSNSTLPLEDPTPMLVQLIPVELQAGNRLRFHPSPVDNTSFPLIYKTDENTFTNCDFMGEEPIVSERTDETIDVASEYLTDTNNYFIVGSHGVTRCDSGLRLNVTVKTAICQHTQPGQLCSGRGRCVTFRGQAKYSCECCGSYRGQWCEIYDVCLGHPCRNGGECLHSNGTANATHLDEYTCKCPLGFIGDHCETKVANICDSIQYHNNTNCTGNATHFDCACAPGYHGTFCEMEVNHCRDSPCRHGICVNTAATGYDCKCYPGYYGPDCEELHVRCHPNPCRNGGYGENTTVAGRFDYHCHCPSTWTGKVCTQKVSPCQQNPCSPHGTCVEGKTDYTCDCQPGYTGHHCEVNVNDCSPNPCHYGGHCRDLVNGHSCLCLHTHAGVNCQFTIDIFNPMLDDIDAIDRANRLSEENKNLYIMAATLSTCVVVLVVVLLVCYCRRHEGFRFPYLYRSQSSMDGLAFSVDTGNSSDCPLASDSFFKSDTGCVNPAYQNQVV